MYFACLTTFAPILTSLSRRVVRFPLRIDRGSANCRKEFARLFALAYNLANFLRQPRCARRADCGG
jgi:hypothetical protein